MLVCIGDILRGNFDPVDGHVIDVAPELMIGCSAPIQIWQDAGFLDQNI